MGLSRPALADLLGVKSQVIERYENADKVPERYRLACAALAARIDFNWDTATAKVGASTVTFGDSGAAPDRGLGG